MPERAAAAVEHEEADVVSPTDEFHAFFAQHHAELSRLAHLLLGEDEGADDLAADAFVALWHQWGRVRTAEHPAAYARGVVANLARSRIRSRVRERRRVALFWSRRTEPAEGPDVPAVVDVRSALAHLPFRKRACVVLRHAFDLSELETARTLGVSPGTVKSQTSRGLAELARLLAPAREGGAHDTRGAAALAPVSAPASARALSVAALGGPAPPAGRAGPRVEGVRALRTGPA